MASGGERIEDHRGCHIPYWMDESIYIVVHMVFACLKDMNNRSVSEPGNPPSLQTVTACFRAPAS
jgi:hypothetical protein